MHSDTFHKPRRKPLQIALSEVAHAPSKARSAAGEVGQENVAFITILVPKAMGTLLRAASPLLSTPLDAGKPRYRHECRHGTQECVRHQRPSGFDYYPGEVCGA